jgi:hypothetical protein
MWSELRRPFGHSYYPLDIPMLTKLHDTFLPSFNIIATPCSTLADQPQVLFFTIGLFSSSKPFSHCYFHVLGPIKMSPYTLRERNDIKAPKRFDDDDYGSSPRKTSTHEDSPKEKKSRKSPQLEQLRWPSPPRIRSTKKDIYRGPITEFNPNLPPAAFPTLDVSQPSPPISNQDQDVNQDNIHSGLPVSDLSDEDYSISGNGPHQRVNSQTMFSTPARTPSGSTRPRSSTSITIDSPTGLAPTDGLGPSDNGSQNPTWAKNMKKIGELGRRTGFDWTMAEMETSDEGEQPTKAAEAKVSTWDDLTITHKLDLAGTILEQYPKEKPEQIMARLRLNGKQAAALTELLLKCQKRKREEETSAKQLRDHTQEKMLSGERISETGYRDILEQTIYRHVGEEDHLQTTPSEVAKAKAYLEYCGFKSSLLDDTWARPVSGSATPKSQSSDSHPNAHATRDVAHSSDGSANDTSSQIPVKSTPVRQPANPFLPRHGQVQHNSNGAPPRHRPTAAEMIAAHSSPVAAHLVPSREFPVASARPRSSLASRPQNPTAEHAQATKSALPKAPNLSTLLPNPPEEPTLNRPTSDLLAANQVISQPTSRKRTASQTTQPPTAATQDMSLAENSEGAAPKKKRAYNKKATAGASTATTATADSRSAKPSKAPKTNPTPAAPTISTPPAPYPWASNLEMTAANDGNVRGRMDGNQKK